MNILIIGELTQNIVSALQASSHTDKIFTAASTGQNLPNIEFRSIDELIKKAEALQIDIAINTDNNLVLEGITEAFKARRVNLISVNSKWLNLETNIPAAKKVLNYYKINIPKTIKAPMSFPLVIRSNDGNQASIAYSMEELIQNVRNYGKENTFLEEFLEGETFNLIALWDGKSLLCINSPDNTTEVKEDRLDLLKTKLSFMLSDENADFTGLFTLHLIWTKNDWYVIKFSMRADESVDIKSSLEKTNKDFLYILNSAIYQKLNEII